MNEKKYKLPADFSKLWLEALRSGEYKQTIGELMTSDKWNGNVSFCCLGVAGDICKVKRALMINKGTIVDVPNKGSLYIKDTEELAYIELRDDAIAKGYPKELMNVHGNELVGELVGMNDDDKPFAEIADWVDENVEFYDEPQQIENQISLVV